MFAPVAGTHQSRVAPPLSQPCSCTAPFQAAALPIQSCTAPCPTATMALMASRQPTGSLLFAPAEGTTPRTLSDFLHHKAICLDLVDTHAYPHFSEPSSSDPVESRTLYGTYSAPSATEEVRLRHRMVEFRASEAAKCGCGVSDIAWYHQTHVPVSGTNAWGQSHTRSKKSLSLSTTLSSGPCIASLILIYLHDCIENSLVMRALEASENVTPGALDICLRFIVLA